MVSCCVEPEGLTAIVPRIHVCDCGGNRSTQRKHMQTQGRTYKLHIERSFPTLELNPRPSCCEPQHQKLQELAKLTDFWK